MAPRPAANAGGGGPVRGRDLGQPGPQPRRALRPDVRRGAQLTGPASFGLDIDLLCDFLHSVILLDVILGLDFSGWPCTGRRCTDILSAEDCVPACAAPSPRARGP